MPETRSVRLFEKNGFTNLIRKYGVKETRGFLNHQNYVGQDIQHFADFCFVSANVNVKDFEVPSVEVSDHLPLILDFEI